MKLDDIDKLMQQKSRFYQLNDRVKAVRAGLFHVTVGGVSGAHQLTFSRNDHAAALDAARDAMLVTLQKELDEQKTRLMMLGITEFPE